MSAQRNPSHIQYRDDITLQAYRDLIAGQPALRLRHRHHLWHPAVHARRSWALLSGIGNVSLDRFRAASPFSSTVPYNAGYIARTADVHRVDLTARQPGAAASDLTDLFKEVVDVGCGAIP
jgi:hypothetical protein